MSEPKERPIPFSGPMVCAILDNKKTQTRRIVKQQPVIWSGVHSDPPTFTWANRYGSTMVYGRDKGPADMVKFCPYSQPGDRLWVREALERGTPDNPWAIVYRADGAPVATTQEWDWQHLVIPSIHMPRWASRINLEITGVKVERLQDISEKDIRAEGVATHCAYAGRCNSSRCPEHERGFHTGTYADFERLWDAINGKTYPWASNPWVWTVEFKRI